MITTYDICRLAPVIPVITIDRIEDALPLGRALVAGGLPALEVTLRTPVAVEAIRLLAAECEGAVVGAGTIRNAADLAACHAAGARFAVSPGASPALLDAAAALPGLPLLPGCATPSEAMTLAERGYSMLKFFPADAAGGPAMLKAMSAPLPDIRFCPTGGVSLENAPDYLALPNVVTVGGSWVVPADRIRAGDWSAIETKAREAVSRLG